MPAQRPLPVIDDENRGFWEAAARGELRIQRCDACARYRHPPLPACPHCHALESSWSRSEGRGTVHTWTVVRHAVHPAFEVPYVVALVELDDCDHTRLICNLDVPPERITPAAPVEIFFEEREGQALPQARLRRV
jgi:hypothetical protein